ncbi:helix-turn-helix transcriptional regulator [Bradyrhizobium sp.]|uniref:helix-turn-helix transcriptional regulator n=1 Tax=Bradyrhizobium sp. TaxID=376 RepID=UPI0025C0FA49|nr:helix-turn-helix transcriptional regulator [Bradyrhizobium sp.]
MSIDIAPDKLSDVIGKIYDSAVDPALWPLALEGACGLIGATHSYIGIYDSDRWGMRYGPQWGGDPHWMKLYREKYGEMMPFWKIIPKFDVGEVISSRRTFEIAGGNEEEIRKSPFFTEWADPAGHRDSVTSIVSRSETQFGLFHLLTPPTRDLCGPEEWAVAELLVPHIRRAVAIGDLLDMKSIAATAFEATLDTLAIAVVLVDAEARIRHANTAAQTMLSADAPIMSRDGLLRASTTPATLALATAIARAAANESGIGLAGIGVPVSGRDGRPAIAHVLPLKSGKLRPDLAPGAVAAVFVTPAQLEALPPVEALVALYELTPTEARVLVEIASGRNRAAAAEALGIADSTVKTHLARVFEKTGTSEQSELAKLVASLTPPVAARP